MLMLSGSCGKTDSIRLELENGNTELKECVITSMGTGVPGSSRERYDFVYNKLKNPVSATPVGGPNTGSPKWEFFYDEKNRLIRFVGVYNDARFFEFWHKYTYDKQDRIITDSTYLLGDTLHFDQSYFQGLDLISYDHLNRIDQETGTSNLSSILPPPAPPPPPGTHSSPYDARGNLAGTFFSYDNKLNPLLTNKIWRFINRDYSVNNPVGATAYNEHGFPLHFSDTTRGPSAEIFDFGEQDTFGGVSFQYDCQDGLDGGHGGH